MTVSRSVLSRIISRFIYPDRLSFPQADDTEEEMEAWVNATDIEHFSRQNEAFVQRALGLGIDSGVVFDLGSQLGLAPLKILWHNEDLFGISLHTSGKLAERARETADAWALGERMFFQVGKPHQMKFKSHYFDLTVSDMALHKFKQPLEVLIEINRITKPSGAILIRDMVRPSRFWLSRRIAQQVQHYPSALRSPYESSIRAGFVKRELVELVKAAQLRARVSSDHTHVFIERRGTNDPSSWVVEREKYS